MDPKKIHIFDCIDGYTAGNPVRLVKSPKPKLNGATMAEKRIDFINRFDWIRQALVFEPRGHDMMSGGFYYPPTDAKNDVSILFIETSGCLPMCGHGLIGLSTMLLEKKLVQPKTPNVLNVETPSGLIRVAYRLENNQVQWIKLYNVPSFLYQKEIEVNSSVLGKLSIDIAYGGNFYAIVDQQENYQDLQEYSALQLIEMGREIRNRINRIIHVEHPLDPNIKTCSHVLWTGKPQKKTSHARNAVLYGQKAIDRSPCGTGTSARMAQWVAKKKMKVKETFVHESIIGSTFIGKVESTDQIGPYTGIIPSIKAQARITGYNQIIVDPQDAYAKGFQVM
ncbi:MAG: 4-hydroxyproline epimerase [Flavobacteriaceae bacterium]|nr:4-hydroxyproline epimerase [Flavobacteriaceae bacterium]MCY4266424.1 4-hydroxyproline epimerase [Flavobacteriaceae bacterium]MCY4299190.1 4-hydroxyproline epimerase [Flavobacteriaceae bacterium]